LNSPIEVSARTALRSLLKARRRALPMAVRALAARRVAVIAARAFHLAPGKRVAVYSPLPSELDTAPLVRALHRHGCRVYLPRLTHRRHRRMRFIEAAGPMRANRLGILEPVRVRATRTRELDLVFVPLLGFDAAGMRLGMGAGYYDRAFAFRRLRVCWRRPRLIGMGYALQELPRIDGAPHDVRLDAIVTEQGVIRCATGC
jgi:5-formyltetrahydrofolate cyclo-ligase